MRLFSSLPQKTSDPSADDASPLVRFSRTTPLAQGRLESAKIAFTTRRVPTNEMRGLRTDRAPSAGDLVLAEVVRKRQHPRIELVSGRKAQLFVGDEIVVCFGHRYATDQFEAIVPSTLAPCHLVASGGVAAEVISRSRAVRPATEIRPIGLVVDASGEPINLSNYALPEPETPARRPLTLGVVGSAMNAGKTTTASRLVRGFVRAGKRTAAAKLTGTGSGGDYWKLLDAGARPVLDFTDAGQVSTWKVDEEDLLGTSERLVNTLVQAKAEAIVLEIADGLFQRETKMLLESEHFGRLVDGYLLAVPDPLAAAAGAEWMRQRSLPLFGICGTLTQSSLAAAEAVRATGIPTLSLRELEDPSVAGNLLAAAGVIGDLPEAAQMVGGG